MVIKSIDDGAFQGSWSNISGNLLDTFEIESTSSVNTVLSQAEQLASIIRTEISLGNVIGFSELGDDIQGFIGTDTDAQNLFSSLQAGDVSAALSSISASNDIYAGTELKELGKAAMEAEDMLLAYQYFNASVLNDSTDHEARILLAITRSFSKCERQP